jgi:hypothetical protein
MRESHRRSWWEEIKPPLKLTFTNRPMLTQEAGRKVNRIGISTLNRWPHRCSIDT